MTAEYKAALKRSVFERVGIRTSGLAGLYTSFLLLCDSWLEPGALSIWLIPSEFMDVNYGSAVRDYLTSRVELLRIHRFCPSDVQFSDALVSSAVVVFRKNVPQKHVLRADVIRRLSPGGKGVGRRPCRHSEGIEKVERVPWPAISDRTPVVAVSASAISSPSNEDWRLDQTISSSWRLKKPKRAGIPREFQRPILPGPRHVPIDIVERDSDGYPLVSPRLALIDCSLTEDEIKLRHPSFWKYLENGKTYRDSRDLPRQQAAALVLPGEAATGPIRMHIHGPRQERQEAVPGHLEQVERHCRQRLPSSVPKTRSGSGTNRDARALFGRLRSPAKHRSRCLRR